MKIDLETKFDAGDKAFTIWLAGAMGSENWIVGDQYIIKYIQINKKNEVSFYVNQEGDINGDVESSQNIFGSREIAQDECDRRNSELETARHKVYMLVRKYK